MNPILLARQVTQGLKDLVRDTLNTTSPVFDGMLERFLEEPKNYIKGPWISVAMPFRQSAIPGEEFKQPFPDVPLKFAPYRHQELAFDRLSGRNPRSTLVATGTGSGKTESYLWPILEHCRANKGKPGIKAILIYPMNALATDQARRIARAISTIPALDGLRAGIYADSEPAHPTDQMTDGDVITRRAAMWDNPPDILLTNYKMLDYLLLRARDKKLWDHNDPEALRFLVVDEMHTFDGAQGADLALLIRRLKHRLKTPPGHLLCVGSSATLGTGPEAAVELCHYAERIFGETFDRDAVIREDRQTPDEVLPSPEYFDWPAASEVQAALERATIMGQAEAARELAKVIFPAATDSDTAIIQDEDPAKARWRLTLGKLLLEHVAAQRVIRIIAASDGPASLDQLADDLCQVKALAGRSRFECKALAELVVSLLAWARSGSAKAPQPLFGVRIQIWAREMARIVTSMPEWLAGDIRSPVELFHGGDLDRSALKQVLPIVNCSRCGTAAHIARHAAAGKSIWASLEDLYEDFFEGGTDRLRLIYHESVSRKAGSSGLNGIVSGFLDGSSMEFTAQDHGDDLEPGKTVPVWLYNPTDRNGRLDRTCPACGHGQGLLLFGLRAARMTAALANTLYASEQNEVDPLTKPRLLMFSDSVQDAAQRAAVAEIRNSGTVIRKALFQAISSPSSSDLTLQAIIDDLPDRLLATMEPEGFVATFIAKQQTWRQPFARLLRTGSLPQDQEFLRHMTIRLGWEFFSDLTYRSHTSQTLEVAGLAVADVDPARIRSVAKRLVTSLPTNVASDIVLEEDELVQFLSGLMQQMRRRGAVAHRYVAAGMSADARRAGGINYFAAGFALGLGNTSTLPIPDARRAAAPVPVTLRSLVEGYESLNGDRPTNWYRDWIGKFFIPVTMMAPARFADIFNEVMEKLEAAAIVRRISRPNGDSGIVIEPETIVVSNHVQHLACNHCNRAEIALAANFLAAGSPCTRIACLGRLQPAADRTSRNMISLLRSDRLHRVVGREHTGLLQSDDRRTLEETFINSNQPWSPNLISATPTLEMGIDIGDLSTLLLCSVPPEEANYIQRIGRTGRRDGNSLNVTFANARAHDMQFWEQPTGMLSGQVRAPGVYLEAVAVLRRQIAAFTLDCFIASGVGQSEYGKVRPVLKALENELATGFPIDWFQYVEKNSTQLAADFLAMLPKDVATKPDIREAVRLYLLTKGEECLVWKVRTAFDETAAERQHLQQFKKDLDAEVKRLQRNRHTMTEKELLDRLNAIQGEKGEINQAIKKGIDDVHVLQFLTDAGILPNYAFPEEGVKLKSILVRRSEDGRRSPDGEDLTTLEYMRPASSALSELAPGQSFYANGREVKIDRIDLSKRDLSAWRFCQKCSHTEQEAMTQSAATCPKCGDEMWGDTGSRHPVIALRSVLAVTEEQKAAIQDSDDRNQRQHDRAIIPSYQEDAIGASWLATGEKQSVPFGFEFISPCQFRDFNFGEVASAPIGPRIAGEERRSRAFPVCKHCGRVQGRRRNEDDNGDHQPRCLVVKSGEEIAREDWESKVFLMREFSTETIRIIVPVVGEANHDDIKSFVSAINLGMRKHFSGKVDHIRSAVVETHLDELVTVRSLYLYDSVPGGSGYLRQLVEHPDSMKSVILKAEEALQSCPCVEDGKTGCYRCVKSYRSQFGPGEPDRDVALRMMQVILKQWDQLGRATRGINVSVKDYLVDTQLEQRFMEIIHKRFGAQSLTPQVLEGGKKGFLLDTGLGEKGALWTVETQVQIDKRFKGLPKKRVDFLMTPIGAPKAKPIVIEMDGLTFHAETVDQDIIDRIEMIRSGKVRVWTLGWHDLDELTASSVSNPFSESTLGPGHPGLLARVLTTPKMSPHEPTIKILAGASSLEGLFQAIANPALDFSAAASILLRVIIQKGSAIDGLPRIANLTTDSRLFLEAAELHGYCGAGAVDCYLAANKAHPNEWPESGQSLRIVLRATLPGLEPKGLPPLSYSEAWRSLWRNVNLLQDLRGFHIEFPGVDTLSAPSMGKSSGPETDHAWVEVLELIDSGYTPLVKALIAAEVLVPDGIGLDLVRAGAVVGMAEIAWNAAKLAIADQDLSIPGWTIIHFDPYDPDQITPVSAIVVQIIEFLEGLSK